MKLIFALAVSLSVSATSYAQNATPSKVRKTAVAGTITDATGNPMPKVQAYIYKGDSATNSSGYTDARGKFETNNVMPGVYDLRLVFPNSKRVIVNGVPVKMRQITYFKLSANEPVEDSTVSFNDLVPATPKR